MDYRDSEFAFTTMGRAVRKASSKRLLADMKWAADWARAWKNVPGRETPGRAQAIRECFLEFALDEPSRTKYACLMTAFGL